MAIPRPTTRRQREGTSAKARSSSRFAIASYSESEGRCQHSTLCQRWPLRARAASAHRSRLAHWTARRRDTRPMWRDRALQWCRSFWVDIAWVVFVGLNLAAMHLLPAWQTIPFLAIWVSLTAIYGFRLWRLQPTIL